MRGDVRASARVCRAVPCRVRRQGTCIRLSILAEDGWMSTYLTHYQPLLSSLDFIIIIFVHKQRWLTDIV